MERCQGLLKILLAGCLESEYDYEENYIYTDGVYDDAYYDDDYYGTGRSQNTTLPRAEYKYESISDFEGPNRGDQSLVSPEGQ